MRSGLEQSVGKFTERLETTGRWLLETVREVEGRQQKSTKDFEKAGLGVGRSLCVDRIAVFRYGDLSDPIRQNGNEACRIDCRH